MSLKTLNMRQNNHCGLETKPNNQNIFFSMAKTILTWQERASMRYRLADMDKNNLSDIGLTRQELSSEANKYFWRN